jgi:predicted CXXCH cytochrome family protein
MRSVPFCLASAVILFAAACFPTHSNPESISKELRPVPKSLQIAGATPIGSDTCASCHADVAKSFQHAFHQQQGVTCEECHGNGSLHMEGGGDVTKIISPLKRPAAEANAVCLNCHAQDAMTRHWSTGIHAANGVRCIDCHQVHAPSGQSAHLVPARFDTATKDAQRANLVSPETNAIVESRAASTEACLRCHRTEGAQLSMPYHHPLREGKMSCADCHDPHGGSAGRNLRVSNVNELCLRCHAQYRGPFAYQHPPVSEDCLNCHTPHGSPNTNLLTVSEPALCLQCHSGHHNGASLPLADRCTNCHATIHGTDVATPSGGSRFIDKGQWGVPSEPTAQMVATVSQSTYAPRASSKAATSVAAAATSLGSAAALLGPKLHPFPGVAATVGQGDTSADDPGSAWSASSAAYRFLHISGFASRVGEYDSLQQSGGTNMSVAYVNPAKHLTAVSRGVVLTGTDYSVRSQVTVGNRLQAGLDLRSLVQEQDHYVSYLAQLSPSDFGLPGAVTDSIPANAVFAVTRRLGNGYLRFKPSTLPLHLFVKGEMQARTGETQLTYLDENSTPAVYVGGVNTTCGAQCHQASQFQPVNYTTRNIAGGADFAVHHLMHFLYEHKFSSFNDRLIFPTVTYTGPFTPENEGFSTLNPPPSGPAPQDVPVGSYYYDIPSPSQYSADTVQMNLTASETFLVNGQVTYTRLRNTFTRNPQNWFDTDDTASWTPEPRLRLSADFHQQNMINGFTPYYSLYGNVSWHRHWEGLQAEYELPAGLSLEMNYKRSGITRSNAALWPQVYSMDNTDLQTVIPSTTSNEVGLALRYRSALWNARAGYDWTGTHHPGYLIIPGSDNRMFASIWLTPKPWLTFQNDARFDIQNAFASPALPNTPTAAQGFGGDIAGLPSNFQRRNRIYTETASAEIRPLAPWNLSLGYSYQQDNLQTYMAFQNDSSTNYVVDEPLVPYKQLSQVVWGDSTYTVKDRIGIDLRFTHNASNSGYRPDLNPNDAASLGNAALIQQGVFDPGMFQPALGNLALSSTQISEVRVPQWLGDAKAYYILPHKVETGAVFHYGSYGDYWNPNLNGALRVIDVYIGRSW